MLKDKEKPIAPKYVDWWQQQQYPQPLFVTQRYDLSQSESSSYVNTEEMVGADAKANEDLAAEESQNESLNESESVTAGG